MCIVASGCASNWQLKESLPVGPSELPYYLDSDEDGWGDRDSTMQLLGAADIDNHYTARNHRDCDDTTGDATGRTGSVCPEDTVTGGAEYVPTVIGGNEFVVIHGAATPTVWPQAAKDGCGPWGWGGNVASVTDTEFDQLAILIEQQVAPSPEPYAAFIGLEPNATNDGWEYPDDTSTAGLKFCGEGAPDPADFPDGMAMLALVRDLSADEVCVGSAALSGVVAADTAEEDSGDTAESSKYSATYAHFICERPRPNSTEFDEYVTE